MPIGPEATGSQMVINAAFVSQAYPNIRRKLQNMDRVLAMTNSQMIEIAVKVFRNRDTEIWWETEKKQREDSKTADQWIPFLAAALEGPFLGPPRSSLWVGADLLASPLREGPEPPCNQTNVPDAGASAIGKMNAPTIMGERIWHQLLQGWLDWRLSWGAEAQRHKVPTSPLWSQK